MTEGGWIADDSNLDPFHLIAADVVTSADVELHGAGAGVVGGIVNLSWRQAPRGNLGPPKRRLMSQCYAGECAGAPKLPKFVSERAKLAMPLAPCPTRPRARFVFQALTRSVDL